MRKLIIILLFFPCLLHAQMPGGSFSSRGFVLYGESEIVLKDGSKITYDGKISGTEIETDGRTIDHTEVDYIIFNKSSLRNVDQYDLDTFKYISIDGKPSLVKVVVESPKLSFYQGRPKMTGGGYNAIGVFQDHGTKQYPYMIKDGEKEAINFNFGKNGNNIDKYFPDCPRILQYQKDKKMRESALRYHCLVYLYNGGNCEQATPEQMEEDKKMFDTITEQVIDEITQKEVIKAERKYAKKKKK